jgi:hypothetical protein
LLCSDEYFRVALLRLTVQLQVERQSVRARSNGCDERPHYDKLPLEKKPLRDTHGPESEQFGLLGNEEICGL